MIKASSKIAKRRKCSFNHIPSSRERERKKEGSILQKTGEIEWKVKLGN